MINDPHRALKVALAGYLGSIEQVEAKTVDWSSATFVGMRHELSFLTSASAPLIEALGEIDLPMRGHFVADLVVIETSAMEGRTMVSIEALTICE